MKTILSKITRAIRAFREPEQKSIRNAVRFQARMNTSDKLIHVYQLRDTHSPASDHWLVQMLNLFTSPTELDPILNDQPIAKLKYFGDEIIAVSSAEITDLHHKAICELRDKYFAALEEKQRAIAANTALMIETDYIGALSQSIITDEPPKISEMICIGYNADYRSMGFMSDGPSHRPDITHVWAQPVALTAHRPIPRHHSSTRPYAAPKGSAKRFLIVRVVNADYRNIYENELCYDPNTQITYSVNVMAIPVDAIREIGIGSMIPGSDFPYANAMNDYFPVESKWSGAFDLRNAGSRGFGSNAEMLRALEISYDPKFFKEHFPDFKGDPMHQYFHQTRLYGHHLMMSGQDTEEVFRFLMSPQVTRFYSLPFTTNDSEMEPKWIRMEDGKIAAPTVMTRFMCVTMRDKYAPKDSVIQMTAELHKQMQ